MLPLPYMVSHIGVCTTEPCYHWDGQLVEVDYAEWLLSYDMRHSPLLQSAICNVIKAQSYHHCVITVASIGIHRIHRIWFQGSITVFELESVCVLKKGNVTYIFMSKTQEFSQPAATVNGWMMGSMRFRRGGQIVPAPQWIRSRHR